MATERCVYSEIVAEPLVRKNQTAWFASIKNYLVARDLWEVVVKPQNCSLSWRKKNAEALRIMQISCTPDSFSHIREVSKAKVAWNILKRKYAYNPSMTPQETEEREVDSTTTANLYRAICENNWDIAQAIVKDNQSALSAGLTSTGNTALHVATLFGHVGIVEELVKSVPQEYLEKKNSYGRTPLIIATHTGVTRIVECIIEKNKKTLSIPTRVGELPVSLAFAIGHKEMGRYLYWATPLEDLKPDKGIQGPRLLYYCFKSGNLDIALHLLQQCEELLFAEDNDGWGPIEGIAAMPFAFPSGSQLMFWKRWIYNCIHIPSATTTTTNDVRVDIQQEDQIKRVHGLRLLERFIPYTYNFLGLKEIYELKLLHEQASQILRLVCKNVYDLLVPKHIVMNALFLAAKEGNVKFVVEVAKANPQHILLCKKGRHIFFFAVQYRQADVFNLIHGLRFKDALTTRIVKSRNSLLHEAGMLAPSFQLKQIPGAALQMQRELQWFKEVESVVPPSVRLSENYDGKRPEEVFKESHKELRKEGEEWMKGTASSCSVVGALVITIMFAAAFTAPGGNNQESGYPIFLGKNKLFMVFIISDALSLFSSTTSVLMFLGILTSRYLEEDFLKSLPTKLIIGLSSLFISIATMMIAFSATIIIMLEHRHSWALLPIIMLASVPVTLFVLLQFPLLVQIVYSTYGPSIFYRNVKPWP